MTTRSCGADDDSEGDTNGICPAYLEDRAKRRVGSIENERCGRRDTRIHWDIIMSALELEEHDSALASLVATYRKERHQ